MAEELYVDEQRHEPATLLRLAGDPTNRLSRARVLALTAAFERLSSQPRPLVLCGNERFFSAGAHLEEIAALTAPAALEFARMGQRLMRTVAGFPAPVIAAISGYCMGGGLDLALACHVRIASPEAVFGHRGAALGIMTGWGGTQRLPSLLGRAAALRLFACAETLTAEQARDTGLVDRLAADPVAAALQLASEFPAEYLRPRALLV